MFDKPADEKCEADHPLARRCKEEIREALAMCGKETHLNQSFGRKWVEALRGDEYEQGQDSLRCKRGGKHLFCCLGVACDLVEGEHGTWQEWPDDMITVGRIEFIANNGISASGFPPSHIKKNLFEGPMAIKAGSAIFEKLAEMNDYGFSFEVIADVIEETLLEQEEVA